MACFFDVVGHEPVAGGDLIEPGEVGLVGVAVEAGVAEDLLDLGRGVKLGDYGRMSDGRADQLDAEEADDCEEDQEYECFGALPGWWGGVIHILLASIRWWDDRLRIWTDAWAF